MDNEMLERLAMDRALGEMPADMAALFDAYVARDGGAASARVAEVAGILATARDAMRSAERARVVPPLSPKVRHARIGGWAQTGIAGAAMAACVAIGFFFGQHAAVPQVARENPPAEDVPQPKVFQAGAADGSSVGVQDFWSPERLRAYASEGNRPQGRSPFPIPLFNRKGG